MNKDKVLSALEGIVYGTVKEVAAKVDIGTTSVRNHLYRLYEQGEVKKWKHNGTAQFASPKTIEREIVFMDIVRNPKSTAIEVSERLCMGKNQTFVYLGQLKSEGRIEPIKTKRGDPGQYRVSIKRVGVHNMRMRANP